MFTVNTNEIEKLERDLEKLKERAFPFATRNTLNSAAFFAQKAARAHVADDMTLRNKFTVQSIQVDKAKTLVIRNQSSTVGSIADYMATQEEGGVKAKRGSKGVSITTGYAAGQQGQQPRTRLARKPNRLANIRLKHSRRKGKNRKQRNLIAVRQAAESNNKYIYMDLGKRKGIFKVIGGKRAPRVKMVQDMSSTSVFIPRNKWLEPSVEKTEAIIPSLYAKSLRFQIKRLRLLR